MPKKRKVDMEEKEEKKDPSETEDIEVKTERLSQEVKGTSPQHEEDEKRTAGRNLRPRKSTCYAEKDSPEIDFDEKQKKVFRRKRRSTISEDGVEEKDPKITRTDDSIEEPAALSDAQVPSDMLQDINLPLPPPTPILVACSTLNSEDTVAEMPDEKSKTDAVVPSSSGGDQLPKTIEKKRPKKKPKPKPIPAEKLSIDHNIVPKTEPVSPSVAPTENKENLEGSGENKQDESSAIAPKPKPKKRIRKKPTTVPPAKKADGQSLEINSSSGEQSVIKQEADETEGKKVTVDGESRKEQVKEDGDEKIKPVVTAAPKKRPPKKKPKSQVKSDILKTDSDKPDDGATSKEFTGTDSTKGGGENNEIKSNENSDKPAATNTAPKKRVKSRPKKPSTSTKPTTDNDVEDKPVVKKEADGEKQQDGAEGKKKSPDNVNNGDKVAGSVPAAALIRKPFFRGRRSKSISARSGRKEIIHQDEAIDPQDLRGFEHVEKYVTPPGVRLPKFWDSEDEMSEDENNDNFRRIMCGFGTNCRIHEVIRPASEIVRRLKELQNTFGAAKSLPLFQKVEGSESSQDFFITDGEPFFKKNRTIIWHTDPSFFKYANNYPSKCK